MKGQKSIRIYFIQLGIVKVGKRLLRSLLSFSYVKYLFTQGKRKKLDSYIKGVMFIRGLYTNGLCARII